MVSLLINMGDNGVGVTPSQLFAPIQTTTIKSLSRKAVQDLLAALEAYEDAVNAETGMSAVLLRSWFAGMFLKSLIRARVFSIDLKNLQDCTDDAIRTSLEEVSGRVRSVSVDADFADVKRHVKLDANESDARLRIVVLSASYLELCEKRGWDFLENSQEAAIKHIISVLQPVQLKKRMKDAIQFEKADLQGDYFGFMDYLAEKAEIFEKVLLLRDKFNQG